MRTFILALLVALFTLTTVANPANAADKPKKAKSTATVAAKDDVVADEDLVKVDGKDVLVHNDLILEIREYDPQKPVYGLTWDVVAPFSRSRVEKEVMNREGNWWRAKNVAGKRFHPAQGTPGDTKASNWHYSEVQNKVENLDQNDPKKMWWLDTSNGTNNPCIKAVARK